MQKRRMFFVLAAVAVTTTYGSVFDDAQLWIKGWHDTNCDGLITSPKEMPDARDAGVALQGECGFYGADSNRVIRLEDVTCPYSGLVLKSVPCYYQAQYENEDGTGNWSSLEYRNGRVACTNGVHTMVMRMRPDQPIDSVAWVYGLGGMTQVGFYRVTDDPAHNGKLRLRAYAGGWKNSSLYVDPGTWIDLAVVRDSTTLTFYAVTNGSAFITSQMAVESLSDGVHATLDIGHNQKGNWGTAGKSGTRYTAMRGSIHQLAIWSRVLTAEEIRLAFAYPRVDLWRVGLENGSAGEFPLEEPTALPANPHDWYSVSPALAQGNAQTFAFDVDETQAGLSQVLRLVATGDSDDGVIAVDLNGKMLGTLDAKAGRAACLFVPKGELSAGGNTMTLMRQTAGRTSLDAMSLGGSFQLGYDNENYPEFGAYGMSENPCHAEDGNWLHVPKSIDQMMTKDMIVTLPDHETACHRWLFEVKAYTPYGLASYSIPLEVQLLVNGTPVLTDVFDIRYKVFSAKIKPGVLHAGANTLSFKSLIPTDTSRAWICFDYWRLNVLSEPTGSVLIVR